jgi:hypothetical protein
MRSSAPSPFRGPWTFDKLENIIKGNRYYLEDKPQWLDEPGEFWVEKVGDRGRIYLRLPGDVDPNTVTVEAGRHVNLLDATQLNHVHISGLTFVSPTPTGISMTLSGRIPDIQGAVLRINGAGNDVQVRNNRFEHVNIPVRFYARDGGVLGDIRVNDNVVRFTDQGAFYVESGAPSGPAKPGSQRKNLEMLRNNLFHIGWRIVSGEHGHAGQRDLPGNFAHRGQLSAPHRRLGNLRHGWKRRRAGRCRSAAFAPPDSQQPRAGRAAQKQRLGRHRDLAGRAVLHLQQHRHQPGGFKNWTFNPADPNSVGSFGHAYYLDGSFKNYLFNNIAQGRNNILGTKGVTTTALQNVHSFENSFFHNTFYKFAEVTRQQDPGAARTRYLSNIIEDSSRIALRHADPSEGRFDPNASHYKQGGNFAYDKLALHNNVFHNIRGKFGVFEETGVVYPTLEEMRTSLQRLNPQAADIGIMAADVAARRHRPKAIFVPRRAAPLSAKARRRGCRGRFTRRWASGTSRATTPSLRKSRTSTGS